MHLLPNVLELCRLGDESDVGLAEEVPVRAVTHLLQVGKVELRIFTLQTNIASFKLSSARAIKMSHIITKDNYKSNFGGIKFFLGAE